MSNTIRITFDVKHADPREHDGRPYIIEIDPVDENGCFSYRLDNAPDALVRVGQLKVARANHPHVPMQQLQEVLRKEFPFLPSNRFAEPYLTEQENLEHGK